MENPIKMDDLGGYPTIFGNIQVNINEALSDHQIGLKERTSSKEWMICWVNM